MCSVEIWLLGKVTRLSKLRADVVEKSQKIHSGSTPGSLDVQKAILPPKKSLALTQ